MFLCSTCHRHVREAPCPFCGATEKSAALPGADAFRIGMKRSAVLAGAVVVAIGAIDCSSSSATEPTAHDSGTTHDSGIDVVAPVADYGIPGGPLLDAAMATPRPDAGRDAATIPDAPPERPDVLAGGTDYGIPPAPGNP